MFQAPRGDYSLLEVVDRRGDHRIALDSDVVLVARHGRQLIPFVPSAEARHSGATDLAVNTVHYGSTQMHGVLAQQIYDGRSVTEISWPAWGTGLGVFAPCIFLSVRRGKGRRALEDGQRLKGPQVVTVEEFNHWSRANGIGFLTTHRTEMLRIPASYREWTE
jgi:hypothetical protein